MSLTTQIRSGLQAQGLPTPTLSWIQSAMPRHNPPPPLPALIATVKTRLLIADLTNPAILELPVPAFPPHLSNPEVKEIKLTQDIPVQVLDIDNLTKSKWDQIEELEAIARGEQTRGREIVRLPTGNEEDDGASEGASTASTQSISSGRPGVQARGASASNAASAASKTSTHRLVLQDCKGQKVYALELKRMEKIGVSTLNIGEKIMLKRGATIARGTVLLEPATCVILGGKVEAWQKAWVEGRLVRLKETVGSGNQN
ncbi:Uu.00g141860.m01.CDS01 [Anthostomella pinea]|uniref:Uu.00g141860.m01.CDS01 n=1 Tax=Anthostomella pinea TaxID=933095 RepID=A0AAI8VJW6_9PEZI|nr:Uu.00g141860.m01.CDS01 [Anthostomella pinea]